MAKDSSLFVRQAVLRILRRNADLRALVPADRMYPQQRPANVKWPFIGYGSPIVVPFGATGMDGSAISVAIHAYAETDGTVSGGEEYSDDTDNSDGTGFATDETQPGEDMASRIVAAIAAALGGEDGAEVQLQGALSDCPYPARAYITWSRSQVIQAGSDAGAFHGFATFDITVNS